MKCKFLNILRKVDDFSGRITSMKNDCFHFEILQDMEEQGSTRGMALVLCLVFGARDINFYRSHEHYRPVRTEVLDVKIKYKALGNSQERVGKKKSCFIMQHMFVEGVYDHVYKNYPFIYSDEFILQFPKLL